MVTITWYVRKLGKTKVLNPNPSNARTIGILRIIAKDVMERIVGKVMNQLCSCSHKANGRKDTQGKIPKCQTLAPAPRIPLCKVCSSSDNKDTISNTSHNGNPWIVHHLVTKRNQIVIPLPRHDRLAVSWIEASNILVRIACAILFDTNSCLINRIPHHCDEGVLC